MPDHVGVSKALWVTGIATVTMSRSRVSDDLTKEVCRVIGRPEIAAAVTKKISFTCGTIAWKSGLPEKRDKAVRVYGVSNKARYRLVPFVG